MRAFAVLVLLVTPLFALNAATPLLVLGPGDPDAPPPGHDPEAIAVHIEYEVVANMRALADNAGSLSPGPVAFFVPELERTEHMFQVRFEPLEGFLLNDDGSVQVDPEIPDTAVHYRWYGSGEHAEMSLTVTEGRTLARITAYNETYLIVTDESGSRLRWIDRDQIPPEMDYPNGEDHGDKAAFLENLPATPKFLDPIDVLVVHTPGAASFAASQQIVLGDLVNAAVFDVNNSLRNSGIVQALVRHIKPGGAASVEVAYDESPGISNQAHRWYAHRAWLRTNSTVEQLRDQHEADLVAMIVGDTTVGGIAYIQRSDCAVDEEFGTDDDVTCAGVGPQFAPFGFSVSNVLNAVAELTFAHEVGHNFGMDHNTENGPPVSGASFAWSYGHYVSYLLGGDLPVGARTVLSGSAFCQFGCVRKPYFSNPNIPFVFPSDPTGTFTPDGQGRYRFNARTAALLAPFISEFRGPAVEGRIFRHGFETLPDAYP